MNKRFHQSPGPHKAVAHEPLTGANYFLLPQDSGSHGLHTSCAALNSQSKRREFQARDEETYTVS